MSNTDWFIVIGCVLVTVFSYLATALEKKS